MNRFLMQFTGVSSIQGVVVWFTHDMAPIQIIALIVTIIWSMLQIKKLVRDARNAEKIS